MSSNYPPGVTGHEIEIAGAYWEDSVERVCGMRDADITVINNRLAVAVADLQKARGDVHDRVEGAEFAYERARHRVLSEAVLYNQDVCTISVAECPFEGDVWVTQNYRGGVLSWECPLCKTVHEEDPDE